MSPIITTGDDPQHGKDADAGSEDEDDSDGVFQSQDRGVERLGLRRLIKQRHRFEELDEGGQKDHDPQKAITENLPDIAVRPPAVNNVKYV